MSLELWRRRIRKAPPKPVARQLIEKSADLDVAGPPILCVTGDARGADAFAEHWLQRIADRGHPAYAVSVRGQGETPRSDGGTAGKVHDVVQAAVSLSSRAIVIGHDLGALWVAHAVVRYPALATVLLAPKGLRRPAAAPAGGGRVLVAGAANDRKSPVKRLEQVAAAYQTAPLLFSHVGHDFMTDAGWQAPLDAILDWLNEDPTA